MNVNHLIKILKMSWSFNKEEFSGCYFKNNEWICRSFDTLDDADLFIDRKCGDRPRTNQKQCQYTTITVTPKWYPTLVKKYIVEHNIKKLVDDIEKTKT